MDLFFVGHPASSRSHPPVRLSLPRMLPGATHEETALLIVDPNRVRPTRHGPSPANELTLHNVSVQKAATMDRTRI